MAVIPYSTQSSEQIVTSEGNIQAGCETIESTRENMQTAYNETVTTNDTLIVGLEGNVKTAFIGARDTTEKEMLRIIGLFGNLSVTLLDYSVKSKQIDTDAGILAGGVENEQM